MNLFKEMAICKPQFNNKKAILCLVFSPLLYQNHTEQWHQNQVRSDQSCLCTVTPLHDTESKISHNKFKSKFQFQGHIFELASFNLKILYAVSSSSVGFRSKVRTRVREAQAYSAQGLIECEGPPHLCLLMCVPLRLFSLLPCTNTIRGLTNTEVPPWIQWHRIAVIYTLIMTPQSWAFAGQVVSRRAKVSTAPSLWCLSWPVK